MHISLLLSYVKTICSDPLDSHVLRLNVFYKSLDIYTFIHSGYFYSTSSSPLLLRGAPNYRIDPVSELTR